ncbi:MAG TPA: TIM-barrel domain-containing protein, partial [Verrucomicrobiae bacterium]|nr:TIM-barrel domain-containing protein [Verrucomicrobiae bacterium]
GAAPMFGKWAWGFWQCKEHYNSQKELLDVAQRYRQMQVPMDCVIQDWHYWNPHPWGSHQFDTNRYPDFAELMRELHADHVHLIISVWARFDEGSTNWLQLKNAGGLYPEVFSNFLVRASFQYYDAFNPTARRIYWQQISRELFSDGIDGWWLDASEPELSSRWGQFQDFKTAAGPGFRVFNAYPLMHTAAVYQGQRADTSKKRVFILTRSAYAGQQRNAAVTWSGDIQGTWAELRRQIPAGLNFSISGIPYWNTDTGGFFGGNPANPGYAELFTRWFQFSAFCPMFRVHGTGHPKEMWRFDPSTEKILIRYDQLRYHLLPYIYSDSWMVTSEGGTMMRPLVMDFRGDTNVYDIANQYLFGPALMVCPVTHPGVTNRSVYLPAGTRWIDFWTGKALSGGQRIEAAAPIETGPLFVRAGSIIPYGPAVQYAMAKADPVELRVYRGANGHFTLYEDEGDNYDYEKGKYSTIPISWNDAAQTLAIGARQGSFPGMLKEHTFNIVWVSRNHGVGISSTEQPDTVIHYTGRKQTVSSKR